MINSLFIWVSLIFLKIYTPVFHVVPTTVAFAPGTHTQLLTATTTRPTHILSKKQSGFVHKEKETIAFQVGKLESHERSKSFPGHYRASSMSLNLQTSGGNQSQGDEEANDERPTSSNTSTNMKMSDQIIKAAAELTASTSLLLGVKSVGVDYGLVRTGIAVSNGYNPQPLSIVSKFNNTQLSTHIIKVVESEKAQQVVMGIPFHKNGTEAEQTIITRNYASQLNCALCAHFGIGKIPIFLWDERYTSKEAESRIRANNPRAGNLSKDLDADAASIILEYYYGDNGLGAERVELPDNQDVRDTVEKAWLIRKEEKRKEMEALKEQRINAGNAKQQLMEKARLLDEKLARERGNTPIANKKGKKKRKKKRKWINLSPNMENLNG